MRKHHTKRGSSRVTIRTFRHQIAGILASGATVAGALFISYSGFPALPQSNASTPAGAAAAVRFGSVRLIATKVKAPAKRESPAVRAVAFARAQIGKPYVWGATGPRAYDCSGLTQAAWKSAGVRLPRTAAEQYRAGRHIPVSKARPGDLVFWSASRSAAAIYHVGIAVGGGKMVAAPAPGRRVQKESIYAGVFPVATRP